MPDNEPVPGTASAGEPAPYTGSGFVAVVEDDPVIRDLVAALLGREGFEVLAAASSRPLADPQVVARLDCLVLDLMLPGEDGLTICRDLRARWPRLPILIVTARSDPIDRIVGLELGADDYLAKPFNARELLARVRSVIRRTRDIAAAPTESGLDEGERFAFNGWNLDAAARDVTDSQGQPVSLTTSEFDLLHVLCLHPQMVLSREFLIDATRGSTANPVDRVIDVQIGRLRRKLGDDPRDPTMIRTVRGDGYLFAPQVRRS